MKQLEFSIKQLSPTYIQAIQLTNELDDKSGELISQTTTANQIFPISKINLTTSSDFNEKNDLILTGANLITNNMNGFAFPRWLTQTLIDADGYEYIQNVDSLFFSFQTGERIDFETWLNEFTQILS